MRPGRPFRKLSLSAKLISSYLVILGVGGLAITAVGSYIVSSTIMAEAGRTVRHDLAIARAMVEQELRIILRTLESARSGGALSTLAERADTAALRAYLQDLRAPDRLDFLTLADAQGRVIARATHSAAAGDDSRSIAAVAAALERGAAVTGLAALTGEQLEREDPALRERARIDVVTTARAAGPAAPEVTRGLALMAAAPIRGPGGAGAGVLYGGRLVNRSADIVDGVWAELYRGEGRVPGAAGTVTLFLDDVRVSTNVRTATGERALGTRVSAEVRDAVLGRGEVWNGRAFVVDEWFITAYEPIRDIDGAIIGMLYVGVPEASYVATRNGVIASFLLIASVGFLLVIGVTYLGIQRLMRPLGEMAEATRRIAAGDFDHDVRVDRGAEGEIAKLARSFNRMAASLRQMRGDLEEWGRTLEAKVRERSDELVKMQGRMAQAERLASIGMLAAGVAHEINNPLGGVLALTALTLEDVPADDPNRENLEEVVRQTERCRDIVRHLLEFSRQSDVTTEETDLNDVLERTLGLLRRQSVFFNIDVRWSLEPDLPPVPADRSQLQQVFVNIVMNAVEAMQEHGTLTIGTRSLPDDDAVEVWVTDTGHGIPQDTIGRIFDPFFTTGEHGKGTGLGLSIAYGIISRHSGTIGVESEVGRGTTFTVRLPAGRGLAPRSIAAADRPGASATVGS